MKDVILASRYAKALLSSVEDEGMLDKINEEFAVFVKSLDNEPELLEYLVHPLIKVEEKKSIIKAVGESLSFSKTFMVFLYLLLEKERLNIIKTIRFEFNELYKKFKGQVEIEVVSAVETDDSEKAKLNEVLHRITGKEVIVNYEIDKTCIGGIKVKIGDKVYDGTLRNKLDTLNEMQFAAI